MNLELFSKELEDKIKKINIDINEEQILKFYNYMNILLEWNNNINLTAITDKNEIILKHFIDSLTIEKEIEKKSKIIDIGTGAGFPGIPISIVRDDIDITLLDSLNKRIIFLDEVKKLIKLDNVKTIHSRVEEFARNNNERESYDIAVSRAVAPLNVLLEYMLPLVRVGGKCICMKGSNIEEIDNAKNALNILGGKIESINSINLPDSDIQRNIIIVRKISKTSSKYPRKPGTPSKSPI